MMRQRLVLVFLAVAAAVWGAGPPAVPGVASAWAVPAARGAAVTAARSWGRAIEVPGLAALNKGKGQGAEVESLSCGSAGACVVGGFYTDGAGHRQGFVGVERHGRWNPAIKVPRLGTLNKGGDAGVFSASCTSARNCAAAGFYTDSDRHGQGFVVTEKKGIWGQAIKVPGLAALNKGGNAAVSEVSCTSAGNCAVAGSYTDSGRHRQWFVAGEKKGIWGQAIEIPGLAALNKGGNADVLSLSCASAGNCAASGNYNDGSNGQGFVVSEKNGVWGQAIGVPGLGALNQGGSADVFSVSCGAAGNCAAVGDYVDNGGNSQGFVAVEQNDVWGQAIEPPGLAALNAASGGGNAFISSVSCTSAGNCAAAGTYGWPYGNGFAVSEKNGVWGQAIDVAIGGRFAGLNSVSCSSPGNCAAGGFYSNDSGDIVQGLVAVERHGSWGNQNDVPGLRALNKGGYADVSAVSCAPVGGCAAFGSYTDGRGHQQEYVVSQKNPA